MPLSSESHFGVRPMTEAINKIPTTPTVIRSLGIFTPKPQTTTFVRVGEKNQTLNLVPHQPRGATGHGVDIEYNHIGNFDMLHLPKTDVIYADDVQNVQAWQGSNNQAQTVAELVNDKLSAMKADIEYTREHLMLGALQGKIVDADGRELVDLYKRFGLSRQNAAINHASNANLTLEFERVKSALRSQKGAESVSGWVCLCSTSFFEKLIAHKSMLDIYLRYQGAKTLHDGFDGRFVTAGIEFVQYATAYESGLKIEDNQAIFLPKGLKDAFAEYFAPANMSSTVNTKALPYYASREKLKHEAGFELYAQSNPLPLVKRPDLVWDLVMT
ncbi:MAG: major capsid protein [Cardiobacteriaceae bacterium]|nr:major capsid protein [Cardiobacteriaceae bacterium]